MIINQTMSLLIKLYKIFLQQGHALLSRLAATSRSAARRANLNFNFLTVAVSIAIQNFDQTKSKLCDGRKQNFDFLVKSYFFV